MASRVGPYQCWFVGCTPRGWWLVGQLSACHSIRDSQRSVLSDGTASFSYTVQDINSSILRRSGTGVGQATDAADTRARRLSRGGATRARVGEAASCSPQLAGACHVPPPRATAPRIRFVWHTRSLSLSGYVPTCRAPALHTSTAMSQKYLPRNGVRRGV